MKKNLYFLLMLLTFPTVMPAQSRWSIGIQSGLIANVSKFDGGDENADALFSNQPYKTVHLDVSFRYKLSERISFASGFDFSEVGFTYQIEKDYSLMHPEKRAQEINQSTCITGIPVMALITTPMNCTRTRIIAGAGIVLRGVDSKWESEKNETIVDKTNGRSSNEVYISSYSKSTSFLSSAITWTVGFEKELAKGNMLSLSFRGQQGLNSVAKSTVNYSTIESNYTHTFINRGSSVAFVFSYYFAPFGSRKALNTK